VQGKVLQPYYPYFKAQTMRWQGSLDAAWVTLLEVADRCEVQGPPSMDVTQLCKLSAATATLGHPEFSYW